MGALTFWWFLLIPFIVKLILACGMQIIYVREDNDSSV